MRSGLSMVYLAGTARKVPENFRLSSTEVWRSAKVDFYMKAADVVEAGARVHDLLRELGWEFRDYIVIPTVVPEEDCPTEHKDLLQQANAEGEALRLSI